MGDSAYGMAWDRSKCAKSGNINALHGLHSSPGPSFLEGPPSNPVGRLRVERAPWDLTQASCARKAPSAVTTA